MKTPSKLLTPVERYNDELLTATSLEFTDKMKLLLKRGTDTHIGNNVSFQPCANNN